MYSGPKRHHLVFEFPVLLVYVRCIILAIFVYSRIIGGAENAGVENAGVDNTARDDKGGQVVSLLVYPLH